MQKPQPVEPKPSKDEKLTPGVQKKDGSGQPWLKRMGFK